MPSVTPESSKDPLPFLRRLDVGWTPVRDQKLGHEGALEWKVFLTEENRGFVAFDREPNELLNLNIILKIREEMSR